MTIWRKLAIVFAIFHFVIGFWILGYDLWFIACHDFDYNDVCSVYQDARLGEVLVDGLANR